MGISPLLLLSLDVIKRSTIVVCLLLYLGRRPQGHRIEKVVAMRTHGVCTPPRVRTTCICARTSPRWRSSGRPHSSRKQNYRLVLFRQRTRPRSTICKLSCTRVDAHEHANPRTSESTATCKYTRTCKRTCMHARTRTYTRAHKDTKKHDILMSIPSISTIM